MLKNNELQLNLGRIERVWCQRRGVGVDVGGPQPHLVGAVPIDDLWKLNPCVYVLELCSRERVDSMSFIEANERSNDLFHR